MPLNYDYYLNNKEDTISSQKRGEGTGNAILSALFLAGTITGFVVARRKVALSRYFSSAIKAGGKIGASYEKYLLKYAASQKGSLRKLSAWPRQYGEALMKKLPTGVEQLNIAKEELRRFNPDFSGKYISSQIDDLVSGWKPLHTMTRGPAAAAIAPGATFGIGKRVTGEGGALAVGGYLVNVGEKGAITSVTPGIRVGLTGTSGARIELNRRYQFGGWNTVEDYARNVSLPQRDLIIAEKKRQTLVDLFEGLGRGNIGRGTRRELVENIVSKEVSSEITGFGGRKFRVTGKTGVGRQTSYGEKVVTGLTKPVREADLKELIDELNRLRREVPGLRGLQTPSKFFESKLEAIQQSYDDTIKILLERELKKPSTHVAYKAYRAQITAGMGEPFARTGAGGIQKVERFTRKVLEAGIKDPFSGRMYPISPRIYSPPDVTLGGVWKTASGATIPGSTYLYPAGGAIKRFGLQALEGTVFGMPLGEIFGVGVTSRAGPISKFITKAVGARSTSYFGYFSRFPERIGRVLGVGFGAFYTYKFVNYLARQATGGWGPTDVAAKMYTGGRELQQNIIQQLGFVSGAKKLEKVLPGTVKSPLSHLARSIAPPMLMMALGKKIGGVKGAKTGLALGIATALLLWGDITQTPEELHKIFTGEQDIPIRKGRYWPFGRTPYFGGKISYWRPHWYPMLRSGYRHKGELWDSETEEWAQGTPFSPILAPILQGKMWDPYYLEKKHYRDRPYPMTGELFEPTMPFASLGNLTIGQIIKPQKAMHPEYWGTPQPENYPDRGMVPGASAGLGMESLAPGPMVPSVSPTNPLWRVSEGLYSQTEMMGLRGFMVQQLMERLTGRSDILPQGPIVQSARGMGGYERAYWDLEVGDPLLGTTEFFRRMLPHKRRQIEEWNPIRNTMPEWLPGSEYYMNFKTGDPYAKIKMGEARLPGGGYESLHRLHSGVPGVYDAVDRFMILADIAPYSNEYRQYKALAIMMSKKDDYWSEKVKKKILQRAKTQEEYDFLELEPPEDITGPLRGLSTAYRKGLAAVTSFPSPTEMIPFFPPITKVLPYKTAVGTYKDYRIHGSEFTSWGHPMRDFVAPWLNKVTGRGADIFGLDYIPGGEQKRREYEDYFDKLKYVKNSHLESLANAQGYSNLASQFKKNTKRTMTGLNVYGPWSDIYSAMPKRERGFFDAFVSARKEDRDDILDMVPDPMQKLYKAQWNILDRKEGLDADYDVGRTTSRDMVDYFKDHNLPETGWAGWHPDVNLTDVKLKTVKNEGMDIHDFNLWQSQERQLKRRPYVPTIENIHESTSSLSVLQDTMYKQLGIEGYSNSRINITRTPSLRNSAKIKFKIKRDRRKQYNQAMRSMTYA